MKSLELIMLIHEADSQPCFLIFYKSNHKSLEVHKSNYPWQRERVSLPKAQLYVFLHMQSLVRGVHFKRSADSNNSSARLQ